MEGKPIISVVIPCYNVQHYVNQCVDSIFQNNYPNIELILINDGSVDETLQVLTNLKNKYRDEKIIVIDQENKGASETKNIGITYASGAFMMFIDSDDWVATNYFDSFIACEKDVELVLASYNRVSGNVVLPRKLNVQGLQAAEKIRRRTVGLYEEELSDPSQADSIVTVWAKLYRSEIITANKIKFRPIAEIGTGEDLLFNLEYLRYCNSVFCLDEPLYQYRKDNENSVTSIYKADLYIKWQKLFGYIADEIANERPIFFKAFDNRICLSIIGLGFNELSNPGGRKAIVQNLSSYLSSPQYQNAYGNLELHRFPLHWKLFFFLAKHKMSNGLYLMLKGINKFRQG